jgi:hypothetical protein
VRGIVCRLLAGQNAANFLVYEEGWLCTFIQKSLLNRPAFIHSD